MTEAKALTAEDRMEIHELYARYAWALGTGDAAGFAACFTSDAVICHDVFEEEDRWVGTDNIRAMAELFCKGPNFPGRQHHVSQIVIEGNNQLAHSKAFSYVTQCIGEQPFPLRALGYYTDVVVKQEGRWLFKEHVTRDWSGPILKGLPGQSGKKVPRKRPPDLQRAGLAKPD